MNPDLVVDGISAVGVIYGTLEACKRARWLPTRYAPISAIAVGVALSIGYAVCPAATATIARGAALGVAASLGYAGMKKNLKQPVD
ncbi:MAG: hypothetical protein AB1510_02095 [Bacillota bacterium]